MARKPTNPPKKAARPKGRPKLAVASQPTPIAITIRANAAWREWMDRLCEELKTRKEMGKVERTEAIDAALRLLAKDLGLPFPPDRY